MNDEQAKALRAPFKKEQIGKLPKPTKRDNPKGKCSECGGWHGLPAVHLDYVGHAAATDRLLQVDPEWTWKPMAQGPNGEPLLTNGGLWIELTVCGVTRPGFGDEGNGKGMKEVIGDAIRNAAMRFGVALDLWAKEDLHGSDDAADGPAQPSRGAASRPPASSDSPSEAEPQAAEASLAEDAVSQADPVAVESASASDAVGISFTQRGRITQLIGEAAAANNSTVPKLTETLTGQYGPFDKLSAAKADELIGKLARWAERASTAAA
jgi:hypothetical protein